MQKCGVSDSPESHRKSVAEKTLSALLGKYSSVGGKGRALKLSFRIPFGPHLPWLRGVLGTVLGARQCEQKRKGGASQARWDPGVRGQDKPTSPRH